MSAVYTCKLTPLSKQSCVDMNIYAVWQSTYCFIQEFSFFLRPVFICFLLKRDVFSITSNSEIHSFAYDCLRTRNQIAIAAYSYIMQWNYQDVNISSQRWKPSSIVGLRLIIIDFLSASMVLAWFLLLSSGFKPSKQRVCTP